MSIGLNNLTSFHNITVYKIRKWSYDEECITENCHLTGYSDRYRDLNYRKYLENFVRF